MRSPFWKVLLENNQLILHVLYVVFIYILYKREIHSSIKQLNLKKLLTYSLLPAIVVLLANFFFIFLISNNTMIIETYPLNILFIMNTLIFGPIAEELIYRFTFINNNWSLKIKVPLILLSSLIFTYSHRFAVEGNLFFLIPFFILGVSLMLIYIRTNNILYCICMHSIYNGLVLLLPTLIVSPLTPVNF